MYPEWQHPWIHRSPDPACHAWVIHDVWLSTYDPVYHAWFIHDLWLSTFAIACHAWFTHGVCLSTFDIACHAWFIHDVCLSTFDIACHTWFIHDVCLSTFDIACHAWFTHDIWLSTFDISCSLTRGVWLSTNPIAQQPKLTLDRTWAASSGQPVRPFWSFHHRTNHSPPPHLSPSYRREDADYS